MWMTIELLLKIWVFLRKFRWRMSPSKLEGYMRSFWEIAHLTWSKLYPTSVYFILFYVHGCMPMNFELSYHPWCRGQLSPLSPTYLMINHLYVETNFIIKIWRKFSLFQEYSIGSKVEVPKLEQLTKVLFFLSRFWLMDAWALRILNMYI